ncbi:MAG: recombinase family protein, partial [Firmicutes bacterium]|nr:recombinase family protein [Bacillota bacterium]
MPYCLYLRKSRADAEAEAQGAGETLRRHETTLLALAKRLDLTITAVYKELVSGETIASRPVMQQLLDEVERGLWQGVLVMEITRLARGETIDQGIVAQAFKYSNTQIITPDKIYHPATEFEEEYVEFGLFMSRREYKMINQRQQRGRLASVKEGKYLGNKPPYGYKRQKLPRQKGWTLEPNENANIVKMIFDMFTIQR